VGALFASLEKFSEDFMTGRGQPLTQKRADLPAEE